MSYEYDPSPYRRNSGPEPLILMLLCLLQVGGLVLFILAWVFWVQDKDKGGACGLAVSNFVLNHQIVGLVGGFSCSCLGAMLGDPAISAILSGVFGLLFNFSFMIYGFTVLIPVTRDPSCDATFALTDVYHIASAFVAIPFIIFSFPVIAFAMYLIAAICFEGMHLCDAIMHASKKTHAHAVTLSQKVRGGGGSNADDDHYAEKDKETKKQQGDVENPLHNQHENEHEHEHEHEQKHAAAAADKSTAAKSSSDEADLFDDEL